MSHASSAPAGQNRIAVLAVLVGALALTDLGMLTLVVVPRYAARRDARARRPQVAGALRAQQQQARRSSASPRPGSVAVVAPVPPRTASTSPPSPGAPAPPLAKPPPARARGALAVHFGFDEALIGPRARGQLQLVAARLRRDSSLTAVLRGHTDDRGSPAYNETLGLRRAEAAAAVLVETGVAASRLTVASSGPREPLFTSRSASARSRNRRVEITLYSHDER